MPIDDRRLRLRGAALKEPAKVPASHAKIGNGKPSPNLYQTFST
jgi:hypothetical protein